MRRKNIFIIVALLGLGVFTSSYPISAEESVEELKAQVKALQERVEQLESRPKQQVPMPAQPFSHQGWDPFSEIERMQEEMNKLFSGAFSSQMNPPEGMFSTDMVFEQKFDLKETDKGYEIRFNMKGMDKEKTDIQINKNSITVSGRYSEEHQEDNSLGSFHAQRFGTFLKTIPLPIDADTGNVKTEQQGDELVITMPKK